MFSPEDHFFMQAALSLAERGLYSTSPNPRVGCVLVKNGKIIGEGFHESAGENHAEINALNAAGHHAQGATAYVTLEPCCHHGCTPPCTEALIAAKVARVIAALCDPNPKVKGQGLQQLANAGMSVQTGLMQQEATELNIGFITRLNHQRPWIRSKLATSLDGKTALNNGQSQWITGTAARHDGHHWRARACAIVSGIGTILTDNPYLNVRHVNTPRQPLKIIIDSRFEIPVDANVLHDNHALIVTAIENLPKKTLLAARGIEVLNLPGENGKIDLHQLFSELGQRQMNEVHVEAGQRLNGALLKAGLIDEILLYMAPCLLGNQARGMFEIPEITEISQKTQLNITGIESFHPDIRILAQVCSQK